MSPIAVQRWGRPSIPATRSEQGRTFTKSAMCGAFVARRVSALSGRDHDARGCCDGGRHTFAMNGPRRASGTAVSRRPSRSRHAHATSSFA
eukprot:3116613-Pleurochrysis_carterae.AAC.2